MIWSPPPVELRLPGDRIHVWRSCLDVSTGEYQAYYSLLTSSECARAARYRFDEPRNRFIVARGILRQLLTLYTQLAPEKLELHENAWGKPSLLASAADNLEFNVAHSNDLALFAFSRNRCIGVDVEFIHLIENVDQLVTNFFSDNEQRIFKNIPAALQLPAFYKGWTRKEAYIKGRGKGLTIPLNTFDVSMRPGEPAALLADHSDETAVQHWKIMDIHAGSEYIAALAFGDAQQVCEVCYYDLNLASDSL